MYRNNVIGRAEKIFQNPMYQINKKRIKSIKEVSKEIVLPDFSDLWHIHFLVTLCLKNAIRSGRPL